MLIIVSVCLGWLIDHRQTQADSDVRVKDDAAGRALKDRRLAVTFSRYEDARDEALVKRSVQDIDDLTLYGDESGHDFLMLVTLFNLRNSAPDITLVESSVRVTMDDLGCADLDDLKSLFNGRELDFRFTVDANADDHTEFAQFIDHAMAERNR